jgi:hypothetical protein
MECLKQSIICMLCLLIVIGLAAPRMALKPIADAYPAFGAVIIRVEVDTDLTAYGVARNAPHAASFQVAACDGAGRVRETHAYNGDEADGEDGSHLGRSCLG